MKSTKLIVFILLSLLGMYAQFANAQESTPLERQVKSAYIFKFGNYIVWPDNLFPDATSPIVIGIVDDDLLANEMEKLANGHMTGNRPAIIKKLNAKNMNADVHILYAANDGGKLLTNYKNAHPQSPTLYITDATDGFSTGSVINFVHDNNRLRFDVSLPAAEQNRIKLDASLLTVARQVISK